MLIIYRVIFIFSLCLFPIIKSTANQNSLNLYTFANELPVSVVQQFEKETGIKVNFTTYDGNETMYAKLKASNDAGYDIVMPSSYYIDRMSAEGMLIKLDKTKLLHFNNLDPEFLHLPYDPNNDYALPYIWSVTGIYVNKKYFDPNSIHSWKDFWQKKFYNKISFLDDPREVFSMSLMSLGYSANNEDPQHITQAYIHLKNLLPNIKLFNNDAIPSIFIDEDVTIGMAWNGNIYRAHLENPNLVFIYPDDGFVIWVDNFAIPKNAPHLANAYKFLNFILRPEQAKQATIQYGYGTANLAARNLLPKEIRENTVIFPTAEILKRGQFQKNVNDKALALYAKYWELLKIGA
jgi:spermidine/putrescine transport system substrate-binding protein